MSEKVLKPQYKLPVYQKESNLLGNKDIDKQFRIFMSTTDKNKDYIFDMTIEKGNVIFNNKRRLELDENIIIYFLPNFGRPKFGRIKIFKIL